MMCVLVLVGDGVIDARDDETLQTRHIDQPLLSQQRASRKGKAESD